MKQSGTTSPNLIGGELCLDFLNAANWEDEGNPIKFISTYESLVDWSGRVSIVNRTQANRLLLAASRLKDEANKIYDSAMRLQDAAYRIIVSIIEGGVPAANDVRSLNELFADYLPTEKIKFADSGFHLIFDTGRMRPEMVLWPVLRSVRDLLISERLMRVKKCTGCGWLFLDKSRNSSRKWCMMTVCGNRAKARRHYTRVKTESDS